MGCEGPQLKDFLSPDQDIRLTLENINDQLTYAIDFKGEEIIVPSSLGVIANDGIVFSNLTIRSTEVRDIQEAWEPTYGKSNTVSNWYKEILIETFSSSNYQINLEFRLYNDGVAFRYSIPLQERIYQDSVTIIEDLTKFHFAKDFNGFAIDENVESSTYKQLPISNQPFSKLPLLVEGDSSWIAINEAAVFDFSMMYLTNDDGTTILRSNIGTSICKLPLVTPWRVVQIGADMGDLIESDILMNLNEPSKIENTDWIKPGKALWDWRNHGDTINGFVYGIDTASYKRLIDFASDNEIRYVLFDSDWYSLDGPQYPKKDLPMPEIINYASDKGVSIVLYVDRQRKGGINDWELEGVLQTFQSWGVKGIKYGFLSSETGDRQTLVRLTREITRLCAQYNLFVDFHDNPVHPGGEERTWPNRISLEYCHAQQDARKSFGPGTATFVPFINGLSGFLDMANGFFDLEGLQNREKVDHKGLNSTVVAESARCMINYSPFLVLPDNGDVYSLKSDLFEFIKLLPDTWDETQFISGFPGEYILMARRKGNSWFLAGYTNENSRLLTVQLDFLNDDSYHMTRYEDTPSTHFIENKEAYTIKKVMINTKDPITIEMAPGGGFCAILKPLSK